MLGIFFKLDLAFCDGNDYADEDVDSDDGVDILTKDVECDVLEDGEPNTIARLAPVHT